MRRAATLLNCGDSNTVQKCSMTETHTATELIGELRYKENIRVAAQCDDALSVPIETHERCKVDVDFRDANALKSTCENAVSDIADAVNVFISQARAQVAVSAYMQTNHRSM